MDWVVLFLVRHHGLYLSGSPSLPCPDADAVRVLLLLGPPDCGPPLL